jgi:hypothetical protein
VASELPRTSSALLIGGDDRRSAYEIAVQLLIYESELAWSRFNVLLVANSIIISGIGLFSLNRQAELAVLLSALGAIACVLLGIVINRGMDFYSYWEAAACELEADSALELQIISRSVRFRRGERLTFNIAGRSSRLRLGWRWVRSRRVTNVLILLFVLVYTVLLTEELADVTGWVLWPH